MKVIHPMLLMPSPMQLLHSQKLQNEQVTERQLLPDLSLSDSPTAMYPRTVDQTIDSAIANLVIVVLRLRLRETERTASMSKFAESSLR